MYSVNFICSSIVIIDELLQSIFHLFSCSRTNHINCLKKIVFFTIIGLDLCSTRLTFYLKYDIIKLIISTYYNNRWLEENSFLYVKSKESSSPARFKTTFSKFPAYLMAA